MTGQIISYEEYYPYGSTSYQAGRSAAEVSLKRYRYTGKERDEESGLYYHGARYYAPWLGRWVSIDPALVSGRAGHKIDQSYQYVENRPLVALDPDGGIIWFVVIGIVAVASLTITSDANAPTNEEEARRAKPSISSGEFAARTAVVGVSWWAGGAAGGAILGGNRLQDPRWCHWRWRRWRGTSASGSTRIGCVPRSNYSGWEYAKRTLSGILGGAALGAFFGAGSRVISGPPEPPPGGFGWQNVFGVPAFRPSQASRVAQEFEARFGEAPEGMYVVGSRAEAHLTGKWPEGSSPQTSDIDLVIQSNVPGVDKWTREGFDFLKAINPGRVPPESRASVRDRGKP